MRQRKVVNNISIPSWYKATNNAQNIQNKLRGYIMNHEQETIYYNAKCKYYKDGTITYSVFDRPIKKSYVKCNSNNIRKSKSSSIRYTKEIKQINVDRTKRTRDKVFDIVLSNHWDYFITLTIDKEYLSRYDAKPINKTIGKWCSNMYQRERIKYLLVPEYHRDGAIHYHGLMAGRLNLIDTGKRDKRNNISYKIEGYKYGDGRAVKIDGNLYSIAKYITRNLRQYKENNTGKSYIAGGKLIREVPTAYFSIDYDGFQGYEYYVPNINMRVKYAKCKRGRG